ncbi:MAG: ABC transporter permease [Chloroflexota bacterium]|nr:ABC transporter permease [Chloroflexota bacterium]
MRYLLNRLLWLPVVMWAVATLTFIALRIVPGNPIESVASQILDPEQLARTQALWGLDRPIWEQYGLFMGDLVRGDLGVSMSSGIPLTRLMFERMPPTIELAFLALLGSSFIGVTVGVLSVVSRNRILEYIVRFLTTLSLSVPIFWVGTLLILVFAVNLDLFPPGSRINSRIPYQTITNFMLIDTVITGNWEALRSYLLHITLPALSISLTSAGFVARLTRSSMLEIMGASYIQTARSKGLSEGRVTWWHAFRNALLPIITLQGLLFGTLLGGAVITEVVFTLPGMGRTLLDGILKRDYPVVQGAAIYVALVYVLVNLLVDLLYYVADPRLRQTR